MQQCCGNFGYNAGRLYEIAWCKQKICRLICRGNTVGMNETSFCYCIRKRIHIQRNLNKNCNKFLYCTGKQYKCFDFKINLTLLFNTRTCNFCFNLIQQKKDFLVFKSSYLETCLSHYDQIFI